MLSFGFSQEDTTADKSRIGRYGNGFKSGSMRLGKDVLVLTISEESCSIGLLSQTYLGGIAADEILVPLATLDRHSKQPSTTTDNNELNIITKITIFSREEIINQFNTLETITSNKTATGTRIIIYNIDKPLLDFTSSNQDIVIPADADMRRTKSISGKLGTDLIENPKFSRSLREYCSILYLPKAKWSKSEIEIYLRNEIVVAKDIIKNFRSKSLSVVNYTPKNGTKIEIKFGMTREDDDYGMMFYHKGRLIKFEKVGCQTKANGEGKGVVGVAEVRCTLDPMHNKQDFNRTPSYQTIMSAFAKRLSAYWRKRNPQPSASASGIQPVHTKQKQHFSQSNELSESDSDTEPALDSNTEPVLDKIKQLNIPEHKVTVSEQEQSVETDTSVPGGLSTEHEEDSGSGLVKYSQGMTTSKEHSMEPGMAVSGALRKSLEDIPDIDMSIANETVQIKKQLSVSHEKPMQEQECGNIPDDMLPQGNVHQRVLNHEPDELLPGSLTESATSNKRINKIPVNEEDNVNTTGEKELLRRSTRTTGHSISANDNKTDGTREIEATKHEASKKRKLNHGDKSENLNTSTKSKNDDIESDEGKSDHEDNDNDLNFSSRNENKLQVKSQKIPSKKSKISQANMLFRENVIQLLILLYPQSPMIIDELKSIKDGGDLSKLDDFVIDLIDNIP